MCSGDELIISNILQHYRYLVWLEVFLTNMDRSHPGAKELLQKVEKGGIAVCVTKNTIFSGGFIGLFSMHGAYQRWCRTTSIRAQSFEKMLVICDLIDDPDNSKAGKHRELERAEVKKSE